MNNLAAYLVLPHPCWSFYLKRVLTGKRPPTPGQAYVALSQVLNGRGELLLQPVDNQGKVFPVRRLIGLRRSRIHRFFPLRQLRHRIQPTQGARNGNVDVGPQRG